MTIRTAALPVLVVLSIALAGCSSEPAPSTETTPAIVAAAAQEQPAAKPPEAVVAPPKQEAPPAPVETSTPPPPSEPPATETKTRTQLEEAALAQWVLDHFAEIPHTSKYKGPKKPLNTMKELADQTLEDCAQYLDLF